jgi:hypothetical protein
MRSFARLPESRDFGNLDARKAKFPITPFCGSSVKLRVRRSNGKLVCQALDDVDRMLHGLVAVGRLNRPTTQRVIGWRMRVLSLNNLKNLKNEYQARGHGLPGKSWTSGCETNWYRLRRAVHQ